MLLKAPNLNQELSYLYTSYKPAYDSLYVVTISKGVELDDQNLSRIYKNKSNPALPSNGAEFENSYARYHATSMKFGGQSLAFSRDAITKNFSVGEYKRPEELTIVWREDEWWRVKAYHDKWISCFYDEKTDTYISYPTVRDGDTFNYNDFLCRTFRIYAPAGGNRRVVLTLSGVVPVNSADFSFEWKDQGSIVTHSISYKVRDWDFAEEEGSLDDIISNTTNTTSSRSSTASNSHHPLTEETDG